MGWSSCRARTGSRRRRSSGTWSSTALRRSSSRGRCGPPPIRTTTGPGNSRDAVRCAASPKLRGQGVTVVLDRTINQADDVTKTHASALDAFQCLNVGPLGQVDGARIELARSRGAAAGHGESGRPRGSSSSSPTSRRMARSSGRGGRPGARDRRRGTGAGNTSAALLDAAVAAMERGPPRLTTQAPSGAAGAGYAFGWRRDVGPGRRAARRPPRRREGPNRARTRSRCGAGSRSPRGAAGRSARLGSGQRRRPRPGAAAPVTGGPAATLD